MTQTLIEQLEKLQKYAPNIGGDMIYSGQPPETLKWINADDLRAIIEQHKQEKCQYGKDVGMPEYSCYNKCMYDETIRTQQSELNEQARLLGLSGERELALLAKIEQLKSQRDKLVEALEDANNKIKKAKAFNYQAEMYISESEYELDGFLGTTAADISVNWQSTIDSNNALLTKAREAIK